MIFGSGIPLSKEQTQEFIAHKKTYIQLLKECIEFEYIKKFRSFDCDVDKDVLKNVEIA